MGCLLGVVHLTLLYPRGIPRERKRYLNLGRWMEPSLEILGESKGGNPNQMKNTSRSISVDRLGKCGKG